MVWREASTDLIDEALDHFAGLSAAGLARVCDLIAEVDRRQSWMTDGARNLTDWVAAQLRVRHETAVRLVAVSRRLLDLPVIAARFAAGNLSFDQVDAVSRIADVDTEADWADRVQALSAAELDRLVRRNRGVTSGDERSAWERRRLVRQWNLDESELNFHGRLPGAEGRIFDQSIDERVAAMPPNPETGMFDPLQTRSADALVELAGTSGDPSTTNPQAAVTVFIDAETLIADIGGISELDNTAPLSNRTVQRLACDAIFEPVLREEGKVVGVGRRTRKISGWLRRQVVHRDGGRCQWSGCGNTGWLQIHHIIPWAQGGPTDLDNLILLCGFHHRFLHEHEWHITGPPGGWVFRRPDWTPYPNPRQHLDPRLRELVRTR